jgi:hypothetical protein
MMELWKKYVTVGVTVNRLKNVVEAQNALNGKKIFWASF